MVICDIYTNIPIDLNVMDDQDNIFFHNAGAKIEELSKIVKQETTSLNLSSEDLIVD